MGSHPAGRLGLVALAWCALAAPATAGAQGILYPRSEIGIQPFYVKNLRVETVIHDAVAETTVEQTFVDTTSAAQEGTYLFPLPEGASPSAFSMTVGDRAMEARILAGAEAREIYESIVRRRRDPALLEYVGRSLVRVSVFPVPANGSSGSGTRRCSNPKTPCAGTSIRSRPRGSGRDLSGPPRSLFASARPRR